MTTYRKISESEVAVGAALTQQLFHALANNPLAYREGDASLPNPINFKAFRSQDPPVAGEVMIAQCVGHSNQSIGALVSVNIKRTGSFRVRMTGYQGSSTIKDSKDGNRNPAQAQFRLRKLSAGEITLIHTAIISSAQTSSNTFDLSLTEGDIVYVDVTEADTPLECTVVLSVGVADTNALWGVDAVARIG